MSSGPSYDARRRSRRGRNPSRGTASNAAVTASTSSANHGRHTGRHDHRDRMVAMTTTATDLLRDAFSRTHDRLPAAVTGLTADELLWRVDADANPVGWLVWHLTRVQDDHMATIGGLPQVWEQGWAD